MTVYTFKEVSLTGVRTGQCTVCGKKCSNRKKFWQTLNPFNKNSDGDVKSSDEILRELRIEVSKYEDGEPTHAKCREPYDD